MRIGLLEPDRFDPEVLNRLERLGIVSVYENGSLESFLAPLDVLFVRLGYAIDEALLAQAPRLRYLCSPTTGHTHIDEAALAARGIRLISLRGERTFLETIRATPEHTFGLILALLRRYKGAFSHVNAGGWERDLFRGEELYGQRVGIIGLGRVGYRVAAYCQAFDADISYYDIRDVPAMPEWRLMDSILDMIHTSRVVVLCASHVADSAPIIGQREIDGLQGRYFINTARGELVDEEALLRALAGDHFAGLACDVLCHETGNMQLDRWNECAQGKNVILTPHIGGATVNAMARTEAFIADKLQACLQMEGERA